MPDRGADSAGMTGAQPRRLVVVGASLAGLRAVEAARRSGFEGEITLIGAEEHLPYDRPPLSKAYLESGEVPEVAHVSADQVAALGARLRLGSPATALDTDSRIVSVGQAEIPYDAVVLATGSVARSLPGAADIPGVHVLRTLDDARMVRRALAAGRRVVVVGAGFIGSEVASSARKRGLDVTILEAAPVPLVRALGPVMGAAVSELHAANGVDLRCRVGVSSISRANGLLRVAATDGSSLDADLVVVGIGADPAVSWLEGSRLRLDNGVVVDATLKAAPGVYAAGDLARWPNADFGTLMRLENWTSAAEQGAVAGRNAATGGAAEYRTVPYFWSDWYGTRIQFVGVPEADNVEVVAGSVDEGRFVALYGAGTRLVGALCVGFPSHTMKYRRLIGGGASWAAGLEFAESRK